MLSNCLNVVIIYFLFGYINYVLNIMKLIRIIGCTIFYAQYWISLVLAMMQLHNRNRIFTDRFDDHKITGFVPCLPDSRISVLKNCMNIDRYNVTATFFKQEFIVSFHEKLRYLTQHYKQTKIDLLQRQVRHMGC